MKFLSHLPSLTLRAPVCLLGITVLSFLFSNPASLFAQATFPSVWGVRAHRGFIIPHSETIKDISYSRPWGIELDWSKHLNSQKAWDQCSCYPRLGVSMAYFNFANPSILGNAYWLTPYVEPVLGAHRRFFVSFRFGMGLVWLDKVYDPITNPMNYFYSSPLSFSLTANVGFNFRISSAFLLRLKANYNHLSNGGLQEPNKGINYPTIGLGLDYTPTQDFSPRQKTQSLKPDQRHEIWISTFATAKNTYYGERKRYPLYGLVGHYRYVASRKTAWVAGLELYADWSVRRSLDAQNQSLDHHKVALLLGHDLLIGRFSLSTHLGVYLYSPAPTFDPVYQRWALNYRIQKWQIGFSLKSHRHSADFLDLRISRQVW